MPPCGRATAPLVHERFTRYKNEAAAARNEKDEAHAVTPHNFDTN